MARGKACGTISMDVVSIYYMHRGYDLESKDRDVWVGVLVLQVWCAYFIPVAALSFGFFKKKAG